MEQRRIQFTTARLLCAMATVAVILAVLFAISERSAYAYTVPPPRWFVVTTNWLTFVGFSGLIGATIGVLWRGEEGFVLGAFWGVIASVFFAPVAMFRVF